MDKNAPDGTRRGSGRVLAAATALLIIAALLLVLSVLQTRRPSSTLRQNGFLPGGEGVFYACAGNGLAAASPDRIRLFSASGKCVCEREVKMSSPICVGSPHLGAYYDLGKPGLWILYPDGTGRDLETDGAVAFVDVNETGLITVLLEKSGSRGSVMVFDTDLTPLFRWDAGRGFPLIGRTFGEDRLCVSSLDRDGCRLHFFRIDRPEEQTSLDFPKEILLDFDFLTVGTLSAVLEHRLILADAEGRMISAMEFGDSHLEAWSLAGTMAAVATVSAHDGGSGDLVSLGPDGHILASVPVPLHIGALSGDRDELLVLFDGGESTLYDSELRELVSYQPEKDVEQVFLTPNGMAYFAGPSGVTLVDFGR